MGVYLWDNHFQAKVGYDLSTCQMALTKSDRDLRLAEATDHLPPWLRSVLAIPDRQSALETAVNDLITLGRAGALDKEGAFALAMLEPIRSGRNPAGSSSYSDLGLSGPPDPRIVYQRIEDGRDAWWDREYLKEIDLLSPSQEILYVGTAEGDPRNRKLAMRAILSRGAIWGLVGVGLFFIPTVFRAFRSALKSKDVGYVGHWPLPLGLGVFLLAYLASIGFGDLINQMIAGSWGGEDRPVALSPQLYAILDATTRFVPPLVALGFLFRKAGHATSRLGLTAKPQVGLVLGVFAMLVIVDQVLQQTIAGAEVSDPAGGLSATESGIWGLVLAVTSACIAAPIAEEILFRGVLFRTLANRLRVPVATLLSSAVFAVVHFYGAYGLISVAVIGVACALCFASSGRLATAILLHALYNSAIKLPEWIVYHAPL